MTFITAISNKFSILVQITTNKHFNYGLSTHEEQPTTQSPNKSALGCTGVVKYLALQTVDILFMPS